MHPRLAVRLDYGMKDILSLLSSYSTVAPCRVCPYAIRVMGYIVRKLNAVPSTAAWLAVRLSYGMNGILIPVKNLPSLIGYMRQAPAFLGHSKVF